VGGLAVAHGLVIAGGRNATDQFDMFVAFDAATGETRWQVSYPAQGQLDYGNSPRATPVIESERAYLFGAFGDLHCVSIESGAPIWEKQLSKEFLTPRLDWGLTATPLLANGALIVQPGGKLGCLVALDAETGDVLWKTPGGKPGHGSYILAEVAGRQQMIGHDATTLGGWNPATGERLWTLEPPVPGDFQVPTPIFINHDPRAPRLFITTENNGSRLYGFAADGRLDPKPIAAFARFAPDTHTPIQFGNRIYGIHRGLYCLEIDRGLAPAWRHRDRVFTKYGSLIGAPSSRRLLAATLDCRLILLEDQGAAVKELDRLVLRDDGTEMYAHPALAAGRLYLRLGSTLACLPLLND
jgi:outer membrane protein assembly factor BamB